MLICLRINLKGEKTKINHHTAGNLVDKKKKTLLYILSHSFHTAFAAEPFTSGQKSLSTKITFNRMSHKLSIF